MSIVILAPVETGFLTQWVIIKNFNILKTFLLHAETHQVLLNRFIYNLE